MTNTALFSVQNWLTDVVLKHNFCPYAKAPFEQGMIEFVVAKDADMLALLETLARCLIQLDSTTSIHATDSIKTTSIRSTGSKTKSSSKSSKNKASIETTLLIVDNAQSLFLMDFMDYLDALDVANDFLTHPRDFIEHFSVDFQQQYVLSSQLSSQQPKKSQPKNQVIPNDWSLAYQIASFHPHYYFADSDANARENYTNRSPYPIFHLLRNQTLDAVRVNDKSADAIVNKNCQTLREMPESAFHRIKDISNLNSRNN